MHIKITNGIKNQYSIGELRRDNPQVSFPENIPLETLASFNVFQVNPTEQPVYDPITQHLSEGTPALQSGKWMQVWIVTDAPAEEVAQRQAERSEQVRQQRAQAYREESDNLFFKAQRGESTQQAWIDKIAEIRQRYPDADQ